MRCGIGSKHISFWGNTNSEIEIIPSGRTNPGKAMSWIIGILSAVAAIFYGMYQLGPGLNKRREKRKNEEWIKKWKDLNSGGK